jgi:hypothetical protein
VPFPTPYYFQFCSESAQPCAPCLRLLTSCTPAVILSPAHSDITDIMVVAFGGRSHAIEVFALPL